MTTRSLMTNSPAKAGMLLTLTLSAILPLAAQTNPAQPPDGWEQYGQPIHLSTLTHGSPDIGNGTVSRQNIQMLIDLNMTVYKTKVPVKNYDYYLVTGLFRHMVTGYASNWLSLGYYGKNLGLTISGNGAYLADYGPQSTVGQDTTSWSVGGSIGFDGKNPTGSASFSFGQSFSSPNVTFETSAGTDTLSIVTRLPGNLGDPKPPSKAGYGYYYAAVYRVPEGQGLKLTVASTGTWHYEYTRLIVNDKITSANTGTYFVDFKGKQIVNGTGACMAVSGNKVVTAACDSNSDLQKWTYTSDGQIQNAATNSCIDKDPSTSGVIINSCNADSLTQQLYAGSAGCMVNNQAGCSSLLVPGIIAPTGQLLRTQSGVGSQIQLVNPNTQILEQFWRVQ